MPGIDIGRPLGDPAELDRTVHGLASVKAVFRDQLLDRLVLHRMADQGDRLALGPGPHPHRRVRTAMGALQHAALMRVPGLARGRRRDRAGHRPPVLDQADVDGEIGIAAHECLGAVQRIDQKKPRADGVGGPELAGVFFRDHRNVRKARRQVFKDQLLAALVGLGHRALVGLVRHREAGPPQRQDQRGGRLADFGQNLAHIVVVAQLALGSVFPEDRPTVARRRHARGNLTVRGPS